MATISMGTAATTTLTALQWNKGSVAADVAAICAGIRDDNINGGPRYAGAFSRVGQLYVPNRGFLNLEAGDFVAFDPQTGWPILISGPAGAAAGWVHS